MPPKNHPLNAVDEHGGKITSKTGMFQSWVFGHKSGKICPTLKGKRGLFRIPCLGGH
jgi:hypothetical protein